MMYAARRSDCEAARVRFAAEYQAKVSEGGGVTHCQLGTVDQLLGVSGGALETSAHYQRD